MNFELFASPKRTQHQLSSLPDLLPSYNLIKIDETEVVWCFKSEESFDRIFFEIGSKIGDDFDFGLIALDGSEDNISPKQASSNKPYLKFCLRRTRLEPSGDLLPIRVHFESHLQRIQRNAHPDQ